MRLTKAKQKELWEDYQRQIESGELELIKDTQEFRRYWLKRQGGVCPVLGDVIDLKDATMDHTHKKKSDPLGGEGRKGLVRAILHNQVNALEGKVWNFWKRTSLKNKYNLPDVLRNLAFYYEAMESGKLPIPPKYIYPKEKPKEYKEPLTKTQYNTIKKYYLKVFPRGKKIPSKGKYMTPKWQELLDKISDYINKEQAQTKGLDEVLRTSQKLRTEKEKYEQEEKKAKKD